MLEDTTVAATHSAEARAKHFGVYNEWGKLREVAIATIEGATIPEYDETTELLLGRHRALLQEHGGKEFAEVVPDLFERTREQQDYLASVYRDAGVVVQRPRAYTSDERSFLADIQAGAWMMFPADPIWVIGRHAVECQFREVFRNKELFPLRDLIQPLVDADPDARFAACPQSRPLRGGEDRFGAAGPYLEGGDILIVGNGRDILVGEDKFSSNAAGIEWLRRYLAADGYHVTAIPLKNPRAQHLLAHVCIVREGLAMIHSPAFHEIPAPLDGWDFIELTTDEVDKMGPCNVALDSERMLLPAECPRLATELERRGITPIPIPLANGISEWGGGIRCTTFVMRRDPE